MAKEIKCEMSKVIPCPECGSMEAITIPSMLSENGQLKNVGKSGAARQRKCMKNIVKKDEDCCCNAGGSCQHPKFDGIVKNCRDFIIPSDCPLRTEPLTIILAEGIQ